MSGDKNNAWPDFLAAREALILQKDYAAARRLELNYAGDLPDPARFHRLQAWTFAALKEFDNAVSAMQQAIALRPDWAPYRTNLADYYKLSGQADLAQETYQMAEKVKRAADAAYQAAQRREKSDLRDRLGRILTTVLPLWEHAEDRNPDLKFGALFEDYDLDNVKDWIAHQAPPVEIGTLIDLGAIGRFTAGPHYEVINKRLSRNLPWELPIAVLLMELAVRCRPDAVISDIGANIGTITVPLARHFKGRVICFEPLARNYERLTSHIRLNNLKNVTALNQACSHHMGQGRMIRILENNLGMAQLDLSTGGDVKIVTLNHVIGAQRLALIKIDVEGHEIHALSGGKETILRDKPLIVIEVLGHQDSPLHAFFAAWGYKGMKLFRSDWIFYPDPT